VPEKRAEHLEGAPRPTKCGVSPHLLQMTRRGAAVAPSVACCATAGYWEKEGLGTIFFPSSTRSRPARCRDLNLGLSGRLDRELRHVQPRLIDALSQQTPSTIEKEDDVKLLTAGAEP